MVFEFHWTNKEANFGPPDEHEINMGTHFTIEIMLKHKGKFVAVRRPKGYLGHQLPPKAEKYPQGCLYFCHNLPRWGEKLPEAINRITMDQIGTDVFDIKIKDLEMQTYPDDLHEDSNRQWAITLYVEVELPKLPEINEAVTEVVQFDKDSVPEDMGWWEKEELKKFIESHN